MLHSLMDRFRRIPFRCFLLLALWSFCAALAAQEPPPSYAHCREINHLLHWPSFPLHVYFSPGSRNFPERRRQVLTGFDEWVQATQGAVCYQVVDSEAASDLTVTISSQISLPKAARSLGQTTLFYSGTRMTKAVIEFAYLDDNPEQFQEVCAHEFGHALGIDGHSDNPDDMMFPVLSHSLFQVTNPELDWLRAPGSVTTRDVNTLAAAYPALSFSAKAR